MKTTKLNIVARVCGCKRNMTAREVVVSIYFLASLVGVCGCANAPLLVCLAAIANLALAVKALKAIDVDSLVDDDSAN